MLKAGTVLIFRWRPIVSKRRIDLTKPDLTGREIAYLQACLGSMRISGDGPFTAKCHDLLARQYGRPVLLTHSCTAALEMAAMLLVGPGDEVILPSFTFVSTANAFVLRGATPVFVDIRQDTLNIDERLLEAAIGPRTRAIVPVHYAGIGCDMDAIMRIAYRHDIAVVEDAAQGYLAKWRGKPLGSFGNCGALSFHETKNVVSGEGGLLILNDPALNRRAHIIREKGTNRTEFLRGEVVKYEWLDIGSSFLPSDLVAAVLLAQLEEAEEITDRRLALWDHYHALLSPLEEAGHLKRPTVPDGAQHNGHIYYIIFPTTGRRDEARARLRAAGIEASTHYVPLHSAPAGLRFGRVSGSMEVTDRIATTMLRLPLHGGLGKEDVEQVTHILTDALASDDHA